MTTWTPATGSEREASHLSCFGDETPEPSVIGWMPVAAVHFRDPDGHQLEYLARRAAPPIALSSRFSRRPAGRGALVAAVLAAAGEPLEDRVVFLQRANRA